MTEMPHPQPNIVELPTDLKENELQSQYFLQLQQLVQLGLLEILPSYSSLGIIDVFGQERPIPSWEEIAAKMNRHPEFFSLKISQGFTKLVIIPFGLPLGKLTDLFTQQYFDTYTEIFGDEHQYRSAKKIDLGLHHLSDDDCYNKEVIPNSNTISYIFNSITMGEVRTTKDEYFLEKNAWQVGLVHTDFSPIIQHDTTFAGTYYSSTTPKMLLSNLLTRLTMKGESGFTVELGLVYYLLELQRLKTHQQLHSVYNETLLLGTQLNFTRDTNHYFSLKSGRSLKDLSLVTLVEDRAEKLLTLPTVVYL